MAVVQIPVEPSPSRMKVTLARKDYQLRFVYNDANELQDGCWIMDIGDAGGALMVAGIPLVTGCDLLAPYAYMGFGGSLHLIADRGVGEVPKYRDLGKTAHLIFVEAA